MRFSSTTEYALRVLALMARTPAERFSVRRLHEALDLPEKYLGRLMRQLAEAGLLTATRGKNGGYELATPADEVSLLKIVEICEGLDSFHRCMLGLDWCDPKHPCALHAQVAEPRADFCRLLERTTVAHVAHSSAQRLRR